MEFFPFTDIGVERSCQVLREQDIPTNAPERKQIPSTLFNWNPSSPCSGLRRLGSIVVRIPPPPCQYS